MSSKLHTWCASPSRMACIALACLRLMDAGHLRADTSIDLERALGAYEASLASLDSFDIVLRAKECRFLERIANDSQAKQTTIRQPAQYRTANTIYTLVDRQRLSGSSFRLDCLKTRSRIQSEGAAITAWNGGQLSVYSADNKTGRVSDSALTPHLIGAECPPYALLFKMAFGDISYAKLIRDRHSNAENIEGLIRIAAPPAPLKAIDGNIYGVTLWLAPTQGYMPKRIEWSVFRDDRAVKTNEITNTLEEVKPGLWLPMESQIVFFIQDPKSSHFAERYLSLQLAVDREQSHFNRPIPSTVFNVTFPVGTVVVDEIRNVQYIVGRESQEHVLKDLARQGRVAAEELKRNPNGTSMRLWFVAANALLILLLMIAMFLRRQRRGEPSTSNALVLK